MEAGAVVKGQGKPNDLLERISKDPAFEAIHEKLHAMVDPRRFVGRAPEQVDEFVTEEVDPLLEKHKDLLVIENADTVNV